jgi:alpha-beta hydrolase superfamily lysophospholipase
MDQTVGEDSEKKVRKWNRQYGKGDARIWNIQKDPDPAFLLNSDPYPGLHNKLFQSEVLKYEIKRRASHVNTPC